jgi:pimeloyl-ACP methyl ester carboxylesterase
VVAWDAPGAGRSSDPPEGFGLDGYADCLAGFVDRLDLGRPHVLGLSFGGILALALYGRHPAVTRSPVLASAYAGWGGSLPAEVRRIAPGRGPPPVDPRDQAGPPARGRPCTNIEAPEAFNGAVRSFLGNLAEGAGRG